jgi:hypothetical protein
MAIKTNFSSGGSYLAADLQNQFAATNMDGVVNVAAGNLAVTTAGTNMFLTIAAGSCFRNGLFLINSSIITNDPNVNITANSSGFNRIDVVYANLDTNQILVLEGAATGTPTVPILTGNTLALANIAVGNNVNAIVTANITDVRVDSRNTANVSSSNGWFKDRVTGFIIQFGSLSVATGAGNHVTLPITFPNGILQLYTTNQTGTGSTNNGATASSFQVANAGWTSWLAIGY